jgi:hypothetical protein
MGSLEAYFKEVCFLEDFVKDFLDYLFQRVSLNQSLLV